METIIVILLIALLLIVFFKRKKFDMPEDTKVILKKYFDGVDFDSIKSKNDLKTKLGLKENKKFLITINHILEDSEHKIDLFREYRLKHHLLFNELSFLKLTANCVIDHCLKKDYDIQDSIRVLLLTLGTSKLVEIVGEDAKEEYIIENFSKLIEGFVDRYEKRVEELEI